MRLENAENRGFFSEPLAAGGTSRVTSPPAASGEPYQRHKTLTLKHLKKTLKSQTHGKHPNEPASEREGSEKRECRERERELVERALAGDVDSFARLVETYQQPVFNIALYKSRNYFDAEDLTQDIFLAAYNALATLKDRDHFSSWLFGIAYNRCHKWFRREKTKIVKFAELRQRAAKEEAERIRASVMAPASEPPQEYLSDHLKRLPRDIREVLTLKFLEGKSYDEIGVALSINANRIDYMIRKGKQLLRARLVSEGNA